MATTFVKTEIESQFELRSCFDTSSAYYAENNSIIVCHFGYRNRFWSSPPIIRTPIERQSGIYEYNLDTKTWLLLSKWNDVIRDVLVSPDRGYRLQYIFIRDNALYVLVCGGEFIEVAAASKDFNLVSKFDLITRQFVFVLTSNSSNNLQN